MSLSIMQASESGQRLESPSPRFDRWFAVGRASLLCLLLAAPLAFGGVEPWAWGGLAVGAALLLLGWSIGALKKGRIRIYFSSLYLPGVVFLLLAFFQLYRGQSMNSVGTREAILKLSAYLMLFFVVQQLLAEAPRRTWHRAGMVIAGYGFALAVFAIIQFFVKPGLLYGVIEPRWGGYVFGPYVNHNHYAGLMELLVPVLATLVPSLESRHPAKPILGFAILVCLVSVLISGSRGGVIALSVEMLLLFGVFLYGRAAQPNGHRLALLGMVVVVIAFAVFSWLDVGGVQERWKQTVKAEEFGMNDRKGLSSDTLRMAHDHLLYGVGLGAFEIAYPRYQSVATDLWVEYAHNDYAQLVAETGLTGWMLLPLSIVLFVVAAFGRLRSRLSQPTGWLRVGAAVGICGMLVHSFSDFNLHIPANAAWFTVLLAVAVLPSDGSDTEGFRGTGSV